jgi:hypothetical protein
MGIQQTLIRSLGDEPLPPPPLLGLVLTSGLYPIIVEGDEVFARAGLLSATTYSFFDPAVEQVYARAGLQSSTLTATIVYTAYTNWPQEDVYARAALQAAALVQTIVYTAYANWPLEDLYARAQVSSATLTVVIGYITNTMQPEDVYARASLQAAILA